MRPQEFILQRAQNRVMHAEIIRHKTGGAYVVGVTLAEDGPIYGGAVTMVAYDCKGRDRQPLFESNRKHAYRIRVWPKKI